MLSWSFIDWLTLRGCSSWAKWPAPQISIQCPFGTCFDHFLETLIGTVLSISPTKNFIFELKITLRGQILKIGGLKEKLLAAKRGGIKNVIIPKENEPDLQEIPEQITKSLNIIPVEWIDDVISAALVEEPTPRTKKIKTEKSKASTKTENKTAH